MLICLAKLENIKALKPTTLERYHLKITLTHSLLKMQLSVNYHITEVYL